MLKSNIYYFNLSIKNPEKLDQKYMFLNCDKDILKYVDTTKQIKELLATIKTLKTKNINSEEIYLDLYKLLKTKFASKSELNCFINACDSTTATIEGDFESFKIIVDLYLKYRDFTEITPKEWIQAIIDKGASRAKGTIGENKLINIAENVGFKNVHNWDDFNNNNKVIARFSKNRFDIPSIEKHLGIKLKFNTQNKMLDIILKSKDKFIFIEAKHLKEGGGSQDKQIKEIISIVQHKPQQKNVMYGAFVDGMYANNILNNITINTLENPRKDLDYGKNKLITQKIDIIEALKNNDTSFWFNTKGFENFVKDF